MRKFHFNRKQDVSGVSGTGIVCEGIQFSDGKVVVRWMTKTASTEFWDSVEQAIEVHGHGGATELVWDDESAILLEQLSNLEHEQWMQWSKTAASSIKENAEATIERWKKNWKPYSELTEDVKEFDREWARKVLNASEGELAKKSENRDSIFGHAVETIVLSEKDFTHMMDKITNPQEPTEALKKALKDYQNKHEVGAAVKNLVDQLTKSEDHDLIYVSGDADNMGNEVARVEARDDEEALKEVSERINAGQELFRQWIERLGGEVVEQGGDEFLGKVRQVSQGKLEAFRLAYSRLVGATLTMGIGRKISEATRARLLGKLSGKDQVVAWTEDVDRELKEKLSLDTEESHKLHDAGLGDLTKAETGPGSRGGQVVGSTPSGKPIYNSVNHPAHKNFTALEHYHAMRAHSGAAKKHPRNSPEHVHHLKQQVLHTYKMSHLDGSNPHFYIPKNYYSATKKPLPAHEEKTQEVKIHKSQEVSDLVTLLSVPQYPVGSGQNT